MPYFTMVRDFHRKMGHPIGMSPEEFNTEHRLMRCRLITEEAAEFVAAAQKNDREAMVDAICDLLYVTFGTAVSMGVEPLEAFTKVHAANMKKTPSGPLEKPKKPEGWRQDKLTEDLNTGRLMREAA